MKNQLVALAGVATAFEKEGNVHAGAIVTQAMRKIAQFGDEFVDPFDSDDDEPEYEDPEAWRQTTRSDMVTTLLGHNHSTEELAQLSDDEVAQMYHDTVGIVDPPDRAMKEQQAEYKHWQRNHNRQEDF